MTEPPPPPPAVETVTYQFHDSSVPPPYHRSFVLTFDSTSARIVVDSYGTVLADRTAPMAPGLWQQVSGAIPSLRDIVVEEPAQGCTGGTGFTVSVADGGVVTLSLNGSECGGVNSQAADRLADWVAPVRELFPPMDQLAPEG